ncbi:MAG: GNAT family N-acetyltransferase [Pseudobutyrivibrio sp.]|nr:GNAT family N-acetyltransferase [Pseudobutyrivibrio sp.]
MNYRIVSGAENLKVEEVHNLLKTTYWADKRSVELVSKAMSNSDCYGLFLDNKDELVGFARVISDHATMYYLCDVIIDANYRSMGLGKALVSYIESSPRYEGLSGLLKTKDAQGLYQKYGYEVANNRAMIKYTNH